MESAILGQPFDGGDTGMITPCGQRRTRLDTLAIDQDDTSTALTGITPDVGTGQIELFAQVVHQQRAIFDIARMGLPVYCYRNPSHASPPIHHIDSADICS